MLLAPDRLNFSFIFINMFISGYDKSMVFFTFPFIILKTTCYDFMASMFLEREKKGSLLVIIFFVIILFVTCIFPPVRFQDFLLLVVDCSVTKLCSTLWDLMDCSLTGFSVLCYLPEFVQINVHRVGDAI